MEGLPPDFLLDFVALIQCMRLSSRKGAHAVLSSAAWQEIRVARLFRPTLADANMGHPSGSVWPRTVDSALNLPKAGRVPGIT
jgi:hypothetical protein